MKHSKRFKELRDKERKETYEITEALEFIKESATAKFDETVEIAVRLGIDPKRDHVRGTSRLPHGTGKTKRVLALAEGPKAKEAEEAGADFVGSDDYLKRIEKGWLDFDAVIATPDLMPKISKFGKILGPRGLMPNPKVGTLTTEIGKAVEEVKLGKVEFKMDKGGCLHSAIGKASFSVDKLEANVAEFIKSVWNAKPTTVKTKSYLRTIFLSSSMGVSVKLNAESIEETLQK
jgi:large subunit ribosomal protein L1